MDKDTIITALNDCLLADEDMKKGQESWNQMSVDAEDPFYKDWYVAIESSIDNIEHGHSHDHHYEYHQN